MVRNAIFGTNPIFFHAAGHLSESPLWPELLAYERSLGPQPISPYEATYTFLTWQGGTGSYWEDKNTPLFDSLNRLSISPYVLGKDIVTWENILKISTFIEALKNIRTPYFIASDLTDVVITGDPMRAIDMLQEKNAEIVFCAEDYFWPPELLKLEEKELSIPGAKGSACPYLNSGIFVGKTFTSIGYFEEAWSLAMQGKARVQNPDRSMNEQPLWKYVYALSFPRIQIDSQCEVFQVITRRTSQDLEIPAL